MIDGSSENVSGPSELIACLLESGIPDDGPVVQVKETHISWVLLTADYAYKLKKPVSFGFVDFSSPSKRRFYCEEELRLNRRLAGDLYLAVVRLTCDKPRTGANLNDRPVEYAVKMRRFKETDELRQRLSNDSVSLEIISTFASDLACFHNRSSIASLESGFATIPSYDTQSADNFNQLRNYIADTETIKRLNVLQRRDKAALKQLEPIMTERKRLGRVRECHGDMHLDNLVVIDNRIIAFDCLEFNEKFRWIDVGSELAFLLMDLRANGYLREARVLLNGYLERSTDYSLVSPLQYFLVYRSMVRAKVEGLKACKNSGGASDHRTNALAYLTLAEKLSVQQKTGNIVITHGLSGCGKTWLCRQLVPLIDLIHLRSDIIRKTIRSVNLNCSPNSSLKNRKYAPESRNAVYRRMASIVREIVTAGYTVIVDATFLDKDRRSQFSDLAASLDTGFRILDIRASTSVLESRINSRLVADRDESEADMSVLHYQQATADPLSSSERESAISINNDKAPGVREMSAIVKQLGILND